MKKFVRPEPIDNEIPLDETKIIMSKTDERGIIEYANQYFMDICGYDEWDLMGEPHNVIRHLDMPKIFFNILMERLMKRESMQLVAKYLAKDGHYYWLMTFFETIEDDSGDIVAHYSRSLAAPPFAVHNIGNLYKILSKIETKTGNTKTSERYLIGYLKERKVNYNKYIEELCARRPEYERAPQQTSDYSRITSLHNQTLNSSSNLLHAKTKTNNPRIDLSEKNKNLFQRIFGKRQYLF